MFFYEVSFNEKIMSMFAESSLHFSAKYSKYFVSSINLVLCLQFDAKKKETSETCSERWFLFYIVYIKGAWGNASKRNFLLLIRSNGSLRSDFCMSEKERKKCRKKRKKRIKIRVVYRGSEGHPIFHWLSNVAKKCASCILDIHDVFVIAAYCNFLLVLGVRDFLI